MAEKEYIEREALMRAVTHRKVNEMLRSDLTAQMIDGKNPDAWLKGFDCGMQQALDIIAATNDPKVVVEVVRCKDCIYCDKYTKWNNQEYYGCNFIECEIREVDSMHYCGHGSTILPYIFLGKSQDGECGVEILDRKDGEGK